IGNLLYINNTPQKMLTEVGYMDLTDNTYYYYLKDHQGNNRVVINSSGTVQEVNHYYPFGSTFAASNVQPYKYNGKELDTANGLNWYDYGARNYDAALGRWHVVDPLSEKYYSWSSYTYCRNNPINRIDIEGKDDYMINNKGWISIKAQNRPQNHHSTFGKTANIQDAAKLFLFAADNSDVEWKLDVYKDQEEVTAIVITDHNEMSVENGQWAKKVTKTNGDKYIDIHSHPNKNGKQEAYQLTGCSDNDGTDLWNEKAWYIGFSSKKNEYTRLEINGNDRCSLLPYHYPQLLSYLFDEYNEFHIPRFILDGFEIVVDDKYEPEKNMNDYINNLTGTFYFSNPNDSFFNSTDSYFATISGMDTLRYHVKDTINRHLFIDSVSCTSFFKRLSDERKSLDEILRDSTYLFHNENGKWGKIQIPYYKLNY
ncbi:MAG: hypothetical protein IJZ40_03880, partial [Bacteroidaceae bacterium]|nr:hypothetical protein [Bacteroidaceae bacterium]